MKYKSPADPVYLGSLVLLLLFGTIMVFSSSSVMGLKLGDSFYYLKRHLFYLVLGFLAFSYALNIEIPKLKKAAVPLLAAAVFSLLLVFIPGFGKTLGGATRWIDLYVISFQPSEFAKFAVVLFLAAYLSDLKEGIRDFIKGLVPLLCLLCVIATVIMLQPDMGTTLLILSTSFVVFFVAGARGKHLLSLAGAAVLGIFALSVISPYRMRRLTAYLDPWKDPLGTGFHIIQSLLAVGSGGIFGLGIGNSRQKFYYLPQQYADFIFAVLCEELGFIGAAALLMLFLIFFISGIRIAFNAKDAFTGLLTAGLVAMLFVQTALNLMVVIGLVPTTGIPLPFISYGGTAMIINLFSAGLIANVSRRSR